MLDLGFYLKVEFKEHELVEVWLGMIVVRRIIGPSLALIGLCLTALAFAAESKFSKALSYSALALYYILYMIIMQRDELHGMNRIARLRALHIYDIENQSDYLCRQFFKLHTIIRPYRSPFYPQSSISSYALVALGGFAIQFYSYTGSAVLTIEAIFMICLISCMFEGMLGVLLRSYHPCGKQEFTILRRRSRLFLMIMRNLGGLHWRDKYIIFRLYAYRAQCFELEHIARLMERAQLRERDEESNLSRRTAADVHAYLHGEAPENSRSWGRNIRGKDCTLSRRKRELLEMNWKKKEHPNCRRSHRL